MLAGNHGYGTESAVDMVCNPQLLKKLHELVKAQDFEALFSAYAAEQSGLTLELEKVSVLKGNTWEEVHARSES